MPRQPARIVANVPSPACLAVAVLLLAAVPAVAARPNILFVFTDDHTCQAIGAYGSRINQTPHMDTLAVNGMRFDRCYVPNAICGPARAIILTGKYSHKNGVFVNGNVFDGEQPTFTRMLQSAGYETALVGKWHLKSQPACFNHAEVLVGQGPYYNPVLIENGERVQHTGYTTEVITDRALNWLDHTRDKSKPFMLMYQHKAPHRAWDPGPKYLDMYDDVTIPEPPTLFDDYTHRAVPARQQDMAIADLTARDLKFIGPRRLTDEQQSAWDAAYGPKNAMFRAAMLEDRALTRWKYQRYLKDYLRCVAAVDDELGRVLAYLDEQGLAENTVVIYTSDQGMYLGEHGWFDKRWMYEESLRTPLIVRWPGVAEANSFCDEIVTPVDFAATFLEIAGAPIPADMQGRSLVPLLKGETPADWRKSFYYHYYEYPGWHHVRRHYGVTDGRFKLIHFYEPDVDAWELFDRLNDPNELTNLYANPVYAKTRTRMERELAKLRDELDVPAEDPESSKRTGFPPRTRPVPLP